MPEDDPLPAPLDVGTDVRDQLVSLAVPVRRHGEVEAERGTGADDLARHAVREVQARNATGGDTGESAVIEVGALRTRLVLPSDVTRAFASIPLTRIIECRSDQQVVLDDSMMPTVLHVRTAVRLAAFATELVGLLHQRGEALAGRVVASGRGAAAELAEFLMLQSINRFEPLVAHYAETGEVHPETFYRVCVTAAGDLATFTTTSKRPPKLATYQHDRLKESFEPVILALREMLSRVLTQAAISIPIEPKKHGFSVALVGDKSLLTGAVFVLAARADIASEELRRRFPAQLKIGAVERIADLVRLQLPGVPVHPIPVAPRQIPYHAGYAYFELDQADAMWEQLTTSGGIGLHVAGEFPGLGMELWAIRS
jgi:type VI secretion system protein ImpJ